MWQWQVCAVISIPISVPIPKKPRCSWRHCRTESADGTRRCPRSHAIAASCQAGRKQAAAAVAHNLSSRERSQWSLVIPLLVRSVVQPARSFEVSSLGSHDLAARHRQQHNNSNEQEARRQSSVGKRLVHHNETHAPRRRRRRRSSVPKQNVYIGDIRTIRCCEDFRQFSRSVILYPDCGPRVRAPRVRTLTRRALSIPSGAARRHWINLDLETADIFLSPLTPIYISLDDPSTRIPPRIVV